MACAALPHSRNFQLVTTSILLDLLIQIECSIRKSLQMSSNSSQWYKDQFLISTSQDLLQLDVINKAFDTDYVYWAKALPEERLKKTLSKSLCFGVYILPQSTSEIAGQLTIPPRSCAFNPNKSKGVHHPHKLVLVVLSLMNQPLPTLLMSSYFPSIRSAVLANG